MLWILPIYFSIIFNVIYQLSSELYWISMRCIVHSRFLIVYAFFILLIRRSISVHVHNVRVIRLTFLKSFKKSSFWMWKFNYLVLILVIYNYLFSFLFCICLIYVLHWYWLLFSYYFICVWFSFVQVILVTKFLNSSFFFQNIPTWFRWYKYFIFREWAWQWHFIIIIFNLFTFII